MVIKKLKIFVIAIVLPALLLITVCYLQKGNETKACKEVLKQHDMKGDNK